VDEVVLSSVLDPIAEVTIDVAVAKLAAALSRSVTDIGVKQICF